MKKYYTYKNKEITKEDIKENPFDLLDQSNLVDNNGEIQDFYTCNIKGEVLNKLTLSDFVNDGVEFLKETTKDKDESGDSAQIGSSGDSAQIGSSGDSAKIGSSGYSAQIGSSGDSAKIGSSGYFAQIGSSGDSAQIGSSGDSAQIGSSGDSAKIGSSGYSAKIGSSGDSAKIGSSGNSAQIGSSGDSAKIEIKGKNSIGFACGFNSIVKGFKDTWISLAEYERNNDDRYIPVFAKSAQIGNKDYKDCFGKVLKENTFYQLVNKEFTPVIDIDGDRMVKINSRKVDAFTIYKTKYLSDFKDGVNKFQYVAERGEFTAHGSNIKEAISDVEFKYLQSQDIQEHIKRVKKQGFITPNDYRLLTGACRYGTNRWLEENNFTWEDSKSIDEVIELTKGQYGHERLVELLRGKK